MGKVSEDARTISRSCLAAASVAELRTLARFVKFLVTEGLLDSTVMMTALNVELIAPVREISRMSHFVLNLIEEGVSVDQLAAEMNKQHGDTQFNHFISLSSFLGHFAVPPSIDEGNGLPRLVWHLCSGNPVASDLILDPKFVFAGVHIVLRQFGTFALPRARQSLAALDVDAVFAEFLKREIQLIVDLDPSEPSTAFKYSRNASLCVSLRGSVSHDITISFLEAMFGRIASIKSLHKLSPELLGIVDAAAQLLLSARDEGMATKFFAEIPWNFVVDPRSRLLWRQVVESHPGIVGLLSDEWKAVTEHVTHNLSITPQIEAILIGVQNVDEVLSSLCHHIFFCHNLFGLKKSYFAMVKQMLRSNYPHIALLGLHHVKGALNSDAQHYGTAMLDVPDFSSTFLETVFHFTASSLNLLVRPKFAPYAEAAARTAGSARYLSGLSSAVSLFALPRDVLSSTPSLVALLKFGRMLLFFSRSSETS
jgi:hypothetical protein